MGIPSTLISVSVVFSVCTTGARAIRVAGPPRYSKQNLSWQSDDLRDVCVSFEMSTEQTIDIEPETLVYGSGCSKQRVHSGGIWMDEWYGRIGNNVYQIAHAIFAAKLSGKRQIKTPQNADKTPADGPIRKLFNFSQYLEVDVDDEFRSRVVCQESKGDHYFLMKCWGVRRSDYTKVLRTHLLPHLIPEARDACKGEEANTKRELVIHLRAGDLLNPNSEDANSKKGIMAPCS